MGSLDDRYYGVTGSYLLSSIRKRADITVETITDRDNIKTYKRKWRTVVGVYNDTSPANNGLYTLIRGKSSINISDNGNWEKLVDDGVRIHFASSPPDVDDCNVRDVWVDTVTLSEFRLFDNDGDKIWVEVTQTKLLGLNEEGTVDNPLAIQDKTYDYNTDGTIDTITFSGGRVITYTYDDGEITSWADGIRTWTVVRDGDGNITNINIT